MEYSRNLWQFSLGEPWGTCLRYLRSLYEVRKLFKEFFNRFRILCPQISTGGRPDPDYKELSKRILVEMESKYEAEGQPLEPKSWQVGRSKVFLKEDLQGRLEKSIGVAIKVFASWPRFLHYIVFVHFHNSTQFVFALFGEGDLGAVGAPWWDLLGPNRPSLKGMPGLQLFGVAGQA